MCASGAAALRPVSPARTRWAITPPCPFCRTCHNRAAVALCSRQRRAADTCMARGGGIGDVDARTLPERRHSPSSAPTRGGLSSPLSSRAQREGPSKAGGRLERWVAAAGCCGPGPGHFGHAARTAPRRGSPSSRAAVAMCPSFRGADAAERGGRRWAAGEGSRARHTWLGLGLGLGLGL